MSATTPRMRMFAGPMARANACQKWNVCRLGSRLFALSNVRGSLRRGQIWVRNQPLRPRLNLHAMGRLLQPSTLLRSDADAIRRDGTGMGRYGPHYRTAARLL